MPASTTETVLFNALFSVALEKKATDIHLVSGNYPVLRLENKLYVLSDQMILTVDMLLSLVKILLTEDEQKRLESEREVRTIFTWANRARFRATVFYQQGYPVVTFRMIAAVVPDVKELTIPEAVLRHLTRSQGIILITGPYNSGKTTTLASLVQHLNATVSKRIVVLERPIEYVIVNQRSLVSLREVGRDTPSFVHGIRDAIDDDVEIVAISELSEPGVHELVLELAESGKLVLALMNAHSAPTALEAFVNAIPNEKRQWAKDSLPVHLLVVTNQRLIAALGGGRVLACEVLTMTPPVATSIQEDRFMQLPNIMQTSRQEGMQLLDHRILELVKTGKITAEEGKRHALDPNNIKV